MTGIDRATAVAALAAGLRAQLAELDRARALALDEATNPESRPENKYDTRALEASYLAAGQAERGLALRQLLAWVDQLDASAETAGLGALVQVAEGGRTRWCLIGPAGGPAVHVGDAEVALVSVRSPLGAAVLGLGAGDAAEVAGPAGPREVVVLAVR